jgi:hypothetical protein
MKRAVLILAMTLTACTTQPKPDVVTSTREVDIPVAASCVPADVNMGPGAIPSPSDLRNMKDAAERHQALGDFYLAWALWIPYAQGLIENCRKVAR